MLKKKVSSHFFIIILLAVLYLAALVIWPYMGFLVLAVVIAYTTYPLYNYILSKIKKRKLSATIMVLIVFALLLVPSVYITTTLISQGTNTLSNLDNEQMLSITGYIAEKLQLQTDPSFLINTVTSRVKDYLLSQSFNLIGGLADIIIGILILFFTLFYLFKDGKHIYAYIADLLPLEKKYKHVLFEEMQLVTNAVIYGQIVIAIIQGVAGGLAFLIFGLNNPVFWGFVIAIVSFLPVLGTPIVFIPAGLLQLAQQNYFSGIGIILFGILLVTNVDSIVKPLIISERSRLNAALILIGVIGGLKAFGFMGFIIGPLVLALLFALLQVYKTDFKPSPALSEARKQKDEMIVHLPHHTTVNWTQEVDEPRKRRKNKRKRQ